MIGVRAAQLARAGQCTEAIGLIDSRSGAPDAELELLRGRCEIELRRYVDAVATLEEARRLDPTLRGVSLQLAVARYHQGDLDGARQALDEAKAQGASGPEFELYTGLLLLQGNDALGAANTLDGVRGLGPSVDQAALYYEGIAWATAEERDDAIEALEKVIEMDPGSRWADEARQALDRIDGGQRWWAWVKAGIEYDDNVVLLSRGSQLPEDISGAHDIRGVWELHAGSEVWRDRDWASGVSFDYYGRAYEDLDDFDQHFPVLGLWLDRRLRETTTFRLRYDVGYSWVDDAPFLFTQGLTGTIFQDWAELGRSRLFVRGYWDDFLFSKDDDVPDGPGTPGAFCNSPRDIICGPVGIDERESRNRDGFGIGFGVEHDLPVQAINTEFTTGYRLDRFDADGADFSYLAHQWFIQSRTKLPWDLLLRLQAFYTYRPYDNASTFPDPADLLFNRQYPLQERRRRDESWDLLVELEKRWTGRLSTSIRYGYTDQDSNVTLFAFDREILGIYVTYRFGG